MKAVFQRVLSASVRVAEGRETGSIGPGALVLLGVEREDTPEEADLLADKIAGLRVFADEDGRMNRSVLDIGGGVLVVSNFTLCGSCRHGRRPEFLAAARPEEARPLYERVIQKLRELGVREVAAGEFGADMQVSMTGDGPVTLLLDTAEWKTAGKGRGQ